MFNSSAPAPRQLIAWGAPLGRGELHCRCCIATQPAQVCGHTDMGAWLEQGSAAPISSATQAGQPQLLKGIGNIIEGDDAAPPPAPRFGVRPSSLDRPWTALVRRLLERSSLFLRKQQQSTNVYEAGQHISVQSADSGICCVRAPTPLSWHSYYASVVGTTPNKDAGLSMNAVGGP